MAKDLEIIHVKGCSPWVCWHDRLFDTWRGIMRMEAYTIGELPPRYPVPATFADNVFATFDWIEVGYRHAKNMD